MLNFIAFSRLRIWNRVNLKQYIEVFIDVPLEILISSRDSKGIYQKAMRGEISNVAGMDLAFVKPENPDLTIKNYGQGNSIESATDQIFRLSERKKIIEKFLKYHYCSRDLHKEPERYYFSKTGDKSFIASFLNLRKIRIDQLVTLSESISLPDKSFKSITLNLLYSSQPCLSKYSHLADYELKTNSNFFKNSIHIEDSIDVRTTLYEILYEQLKSGINSEEEYILDQLTRKFE